MNAPWHVRGEAHGSSMAQPSVARPFGQRRSVSSLEWTPVFAKDISYIPYIHACQQEHTQGIAPRLTCRSLALAFSLANGAHPHGVHKFVHPQKH